MTAYTNISILPLAGAGGSATLLKRMAKRPSLSTRIIPTESEGRERDVI